MAGVQPIARMVVSRIGVPQCPPATARFPRDLVPRIPRYNVLPAAPTSRYVAVPRNPHPIADVQPLIPADEGRVSVH